MMSGLPPQKRKREEGFTLLEILVALSVLAISLVMFMELFSANLRNLAASDRYIHAMSRAESIMREIVETEPLKEAPLSGTTEDGFRYSATLTPVMEERTSTLASDLTRISLTISWNDGVREKTVSLETHKIVERTP